MNSEPDEKKPQGHAHLIAIDTLVVHKYAGSAALLRKADKVAREIIDGELREGEYLQVIKPGRYHLHLPKLRHDAGQLRSSVITDQIERAIRHLNPTAFQLRESDEGLLAPPSTKGASTKGASTTDAPSTDLNQRSSSPASDADEVEMRKTASEAMKMMIGAKVATREELIGSQFGRLLEAETELKLLPVWNVKNKLISAYECTPIRRGGGLPASALQQSGLELVEIKAIIDTIVYGHVGALLKRNLSEQKKALLICPVHASTLSETRYIGAFLASGADIPDAALKSVVFLVTGLKTPISRLRVRDLTQYLRARSRGLVADVSPDIDDFGIFKEFGFHGVRMSTAAAGITEERFLKSMNSFVEKCENAKLESFIAGVKTSSVALGALASGCTYLSGSVIAQSSNHHGEIETFDIDSLFS